MVEQRAENNARIRFLSADEEERLRAAIKKRFPKHMPEFDVALNTGMRKSEQFCLEWSQVSLNRKRIRLEKTKNGSDREIPLNKACLYVLEALHGIRPHNGRIFSRVVNGEFSSPIMFDQLRHRRHTGPEARITRIDLVNNPFDELAGIRHGFELFNSS